MLHTKFRGTRSTDSGEADCLRVLTIYERGSHLGNVTLMPRTYFISPTHRGCINILALIGQVVSEKLFEIVNGRRRRRTDDGRTPEHGYTISSPGQPSTQVS